MADQRDLEIAVLAAAVADADALDKVAGALDGYPFTNASLQWLWDRLREVARRREPVSLRSFRALLAAEGAQRRDALQEAVEVVWGAVVADGASAAPATDCATLRELARRTAVIEGMNSATKAVVRGDVDAAAATMVRAGSDASALSESNPLEVSSLVDWDDWNRQESASPGQRPVPTGVRRLDESLGGGMSRGEMGLIAATTSMGKSTLAVNFGYTAFKHGFRVLHVDTENGLDAVRYRYMGRIHRKPTNALQRRRAGYSETIDAWARMNKDDLDQRIRIVSAGVDSTSEKQLEARVERLIADGFRPDLVVLDQADQLALDAGDNVAFAYKRRYEWFKGWIHARRLGVVGWLVTQADEKAAGRIAGTKDIAWSRDKGKIADVCISINPGYDAKGRMLGLEQMDGQRSLYVAKARRAKARYVIKLETDFATSYMAEDLGS